MKKNFTKYWPVAIVLLLIITNPSITAFKAYLGENTYQGLKRPVNLFVCSVYKGRGDEYIGLLGNFIEFPKKQVAVRALNPDSAKMDSSQMVDTSNHPADPFTKYGGYGKNDVPVKK